MEAIRIEVTGNIAKVIEKPSRITSGTVGMPVEFTFGGVWDGLKKVAVFQAGYVRKYMTLADGATSVPMEVLAKPNVRLNIGVYGVNEDGSLAIPTIWVNLGKIREGAVPGCSAGSDIGLAKKYYDQGELAAENAEASAQKAKSEAGVAENAADRAEASATAASEAAKNAADSATEAGESAEYANIQTTQNMNAAINAQHYAEEAADRAEKAAQIATNEAAAAGETVEYAIIETTQNMNASINARHFAEKAAENAEEAVSGIEPAIDAIIDIQNQLMGGDVPITDEYEIPAYWETELQAGVDAINSALESAGRNKSAFLWYHDAHWTNNSKMSPKLMKYLCKRTAMNKVNFGGDIVSTETANSREDWAYIYDWRDAVKDLPNHHSVRGNHDDDVPGLQTDKALYAFLMAAEETPDIVRGGDFYYYVDDASEKTRYLYLDTQVGTTLTNQGDPVAVQFVVEALNSTPKDWHIVTIAHIWFLYDDWNTPKVGKIPDYCKQLLDIFDAYNARSGGSVTVRGTDISYNFANCVGKVEFCIGGHTHVDYDFTSDGGIPVILTEADCYEWRSGYDATPGTIGESSVDGIIADYDAKKVSVIRIGRGENREVALAVDDPKYTNVLPASIDSTGAIFNGGKGWAANSRIGASKPLEGYIGSGNYYTTGYIEIDPSADVTVRMRNISLDKSRTSDIGVAFYGSDFMRVPFGNASSNDDFLYPTRFFEQYMNLSPVLDGTNIVQFTLTTEQYLYSDIKYIAICADYIGDDSIITVNEVIE